MTLRNFPPADACSPEDLDAIADLVVRDPSASWDLAGSRAHIEALCRRYQVLVQERDAARWADGVRSQAGEAIIAQRDAARIEIRALQSTLDAERNERQGEVLVAEADRERAHDAETAAELFETIARTMWALLARRVHVDPPSLAEVVHAVDGRLARGRARDQRVIARLTQQVESMALLLDQQQKTRELDDQLRSTTRAVTGRDYEVVQQDLDAELAAHPDAGPLHHARDQRDHQEDTTP